MEQSRVRLVLPWWSWKEVASSHPPKQVGVSFREEYLVCGLLLDMQLALLGRYEICKPILLVWYRLVEEGQEGLLKVMFNTCLNCCWPLLEVSDDGPIKLAEGRFLVGLDVIVFAVIPAFPLRTHQGMELIQHSFDPLLARLLRTVGEEVPPLQCLPLFAWLALHQ